MNVDEAIRQFADHSEFPREAVQWTLDNWEEASPRLISRLRAYAAGKAGPDANLDVILYIVCLCAEKCDSRAYSPICDLIARGEDADEWLGGDVTFMLNGILINVCDGDVEPLQRAIEAPGGDPFARGDAIEALAYLVRAKGVLTDDEMRAYLEKLLAEMEPREESRIWCAWAFAVAQLGYEPMRPDVARVFTKGWVDPSVASLEDFYADLQLARRDPDGMAAFVEAGIGPFESAIEVLEGEPKSEAAQSNPVKSAGRPGAVAYYDAPLKNPFRDVGRNDPCPCGSGKKFKKCCLEAETKRVV
jgi:hypothetical protein